MEGSSEGEVSVDLIEISKRSSGGLTSGNRSRCRLRLDGGVQRPGFRILVLLFIGTIQVGVLLSPLGSGGGGGVVVVVVGVGFASTARAQVGVVVLHGNRLKIDKVRSAKQLEEIEFQRERD